MVPLHVAVLPQSSVAVHVRVRPYVLPHEPGVVESTKVMVTVASHASVAVGGVNTGTAGHVIGVVCATHVIVGAVISCTIIVPVQVAVLPQSSVAVQVRVVLYVPTHDPGVVASTNVMVTVASQASVAVGGVNTGKAGQVTGVVCATHVIVGGVMSCTTIVPVQVAVFPQSSVAVHVRVVLYAPTHDPGVVASTNVIVTVASQASVAVGGVNTGNAGQLTGVVCATQVIVGGVISWTTIVPLQVAVLPQSSVAVQVRVVLYVPVHEPGVDASTNVIVTVASQASVAVGGVKTGKAGQSTGEVCATQVIVGAVISWTTIVPLQVAVLPQSSVAVQVRVVLYVPVHEPGVDASTKVIVTVASQASVAVGDVKTGSAGQLTGVVCATQVIVGGVISWTTIVLLHVAVFPQSSDAVQVRVVLYVPAHEPGVDASTRVIVTVASHASVAVGGVKTGKAGQLTGVVCAIQVIVGGVISCTTIVPLHVAVFPQSSVAVHVVVVLYDPAQEPGVEASTKVIVTVASHASVAVGGVNTGSAGQLTGVVCAIQVIVGGVISCTTIVPLHVAVFPQSSVAVHVVVVLYDPAQEPGVEASTKVIVTVASHASVAVGGVNTGSAGQLTGVV